MYQIKAKIQKIDLEGGFWGIIDTETQKKYLPDQDLPEEFQQNEQMVKVTFEPSDKMSIYQWGRMIHILTIEKAE